MGEVGDDLGMKPKNTGDRAMTITVIKSASVRRPSNQKVLDPFFSGMAEAYGHYIVKAAHIAKDLPEVSPNTLFRSLAASLIIRA